MLDTISRLDALSLPLDAAPPVRLPRVEIVQARTVSIIDSSGRCVRMEAFMSILRDEVVVKAADMEAQGLMAGGGKSRASTVTDIYDVARLEQRFRQALTGSVATADSSALGGGAAFAAA